MQELKSKILKQRLYSIHSSIGISLSLFMYISLFFGGFTIFKPFIEVWEKPSRHFERSNIKTINYETILESVISDPNYPKNNIYIELPGLSKDPTIRITHQFMKGNYFNPNTGIEIDLKDEITYLGDFLNHLHYGRPLMIIGKVIFGLVAVGTMVLILGGLLLVSKLKFQNQGKNQQSNFSKWHREIFIYVSPIFFIIVLTGALMNIGYLTSKPLTFTVTKGKSSDFVIVTNSILKPIDKPITWLNEKSNMMSIQQLTAKAEEINSNANFKELRLINWKDKSARIEFIGYNPYKPFMNGIYNKEKVLLNAVDGSLIKDTRAEDSQWSLLFADAFYFIHLLYDVDIFIRTIVALLMFFTSLAIGFGVMLWLEKKAKKFHDIIPFYHWVGKFSLSIMVGVIPATALLFVSQWLLPFDLENKITIQQVIFYLAWLSTLTWSFYRINSYTAAKEFLSLGGVLFILASMIHLKISGFSLLNLYEMGMFDILSVDISLILIGVLLLICSKKLPKNRLEAKSFWHKNHKGVNNE